MSGMETPKHLGRQIAPHLYVVPVVRELVVIQQEPADDFLDNVVPLPTKTDPEDLVA